MRVSWFLLGLVLAAFLLGCDLIERKMESSIEDVIEDTRDSTNQTMSDIQCDDLVPQIIRAEEADPRAPQILKVYDAREVTRSYFRLECVGNAITFPEREASLSFGLREAQNGDRSFEYSLEYRRYMADTQCGGLVPKIIDMSESNKDPLASKILKVYNAKEVTRSNRRLECEGIARTSSDGWSRVSFHIEEDWDGDRFIGYSLD